MLGKRSGKALKSKGNRLSEERFSSPDQISLIVSRAMETASKIEEGNQCVKSLPAMFKHQLTHEKEGLPMLRSHLALFTFHMRRVRSQPAREKLHPRVKIDSWCV
jgi:hypothetical protein